MVEYITPGHFEIVFLENFILNEHDHKYAGSLNILNPSGHSQTCLQIYNLFTQK